MDMFDVGFSFDFSFFCVRFSPNLPRTHLPALSVGLHLVFIGDPLREVGGFGALICVVYGAKVGD